ncbi:MAG: helix-turn-helix domain-containing protein [Gemmatimonadaceae bacterium]|nr:helix-turn-helix domain-containing protein [Gemmatimonadaceae bacterium]
MTSRSAVPAITNTSISCDAENRVSAHSTILLDDPPLLSAESPLQRRIDEDDALRHALQRDVAAEIAEQLIRLRRFRGFTQQQVADRLGTGQPAIARHESATSNLRCSTLESLAEALGGVVRVDLIPEECEHLRRQFPRWWTVLDGLSRAATYEWTFKASAVLRQLDSQPDFETLSAHREEYIATRQADAAFASWFARS